MVCLLPRFACCVEGDVMMMGCVFPLYAAASMSQSGLDLIEEKNIVMVALHCCGSEQTVCLSNAAFGTTTWGMKVCDT